MDGCMWFVGERNRITKIAAKKRIPEVAVGNPVSASSTSDRRN